jgi:hypothetical protein
VNWAHRAAGLAPDEVAGLRDSLLAGLAAGMRPREATAEALASPRTGAARGRLGAREVRRGGHPEWGAAGTGHPE